MTNLIIGILATWRLASLLFREGGPFQMFDRFRALFGVGKDETGDTVCRRPGNQFCKMLECFWCTSVWAALAITILERDVNLVHILAYSAGAIFLGFIDVRLNERPTTVSAVVKSRHNGVHSLN